MNNAEKDLISIIMSVYNVDKFLSKSIESIINQTYKNWELIIVNDLSTDNSKEICLSFVDKDNRIKYFESNKQQSGVSVTRNIALEHCKGKYICYVDADDWVEANYLYELYKAISENNSEIAICDYYIFDGNDNQPANLFKNENILEPNVFKDKLLKNEIYSFMWNKILLKDLYKDIRFIPNVSFQDMRFFDKVLPKIHKDVPVINKPLYHYFQRNNSMVHIRKQKRELDYFEALKARFELDYINNEQKAYVLKYMLISFYYFYQINDLDYKILNDCINYINNVPSYIYGKAKKLLTPKELIRFLLAYYFPLIYKLIFKIYSMVKNIYLKLANLRKLKWN